MSYSKKNEDYKEPEKLNEEEKPDEAEKSKKTILRLIRNYKIEVILMILAVISAVSYIYISNENVRRKQELSKELKKTYSYQVYIDSDSDSDDLLNTLYDGFYGMSEDMYFKYQVKNIGDTVSHYEVADSAVSGRAEGKINLTVTELEKPEECSLIEKVQGGAYIRLKVELENLMAEDCIVSINTMRLFIMDDKGYQIFDSAYELDTPGLGPKLEECGDKLDCYYYAIDMSQVGQYVPIELNSKNHQWMLIKKGETITYNLYYEISETIVDDSRLVFANGAAHQKNGYNNMGFSIYLNRQPED